MRQYAMKYVGALALVWGLVGVAEAQTTYTVNATHNGNDGVCNGDGLGDSMAAVSDSAPTVDDATDCTLAEAIALANGDVAQDTIEFDISGAAPYLINDPLDDSPAFISEGIIIDGTSEPNFGDLGANVPVVYIQNTGTLLGQPADGLLIFSFTAASDFQFYGLGFGGSAANGLRLFGTATSTFTVQGCWFGLNGDDTANGNAERGLYIGQGASYLIGGPNAADQNIFSNNGLDGIAAVVDADSQTLGGVTIQNNLIGFESDGSTAAGNGEAGIDFIDLDADVTPDVEVAGVIDNRIGNSGQAGIALTEVAPVGATVAIQNNIIGIAADGSAAANATATEAGVSVLNSEDIQVGSNLVGDGDGNVISNSGRSGLQVSSSLRVSIVENFIGTNEAGDDEGFGNGTNATASFDRGIALRGTSVINEITDNVVVDSIGNGIHFAGPNVRGPLGGTDPIVVRGNLIGEDLSGDAAGNGGAGVYIDRAYVTLGGIAAGQGNVIRDSGSDGVVLTQINGATLSNSTLRGNSIYGNTGLGIDIQDDGPSINDYTDDDTNANGTLNHPILYQVIDQGGGNVRLIGAVSAGMTVDVYSGGAEANGFGEGQTYADSFTEGGLGDDDNGFGFYWDAENASLIDAGIARFDVTVTGVVDADAISLVAYDAGGTGATSEFGGLIGASVLDSDGDGLFDIDENALGLDPLGDNDADGIPNYVDADDRGDGQPSDCLATANVCDGFARNQVGPANWTDIYDANNDGVPEFAEVGAFGDRDADGVLDDADLDTDGDGIPNALESVDGSNPVADSDADGIPAFRDPDESTCTNDAAPLEICDGGAGNLDPVYDPDGDGVASHLDLDSDGDGIVDAIEVGHGLFDALGFAVGDVGANGLTDALEDGNESGGVDYVQLDTDGDGTPDWLDLDSDADGRFDINEAGLRSADADDDGVADSTTDSDGDGLVGNTDGDDEAFGDPAASLEDRDGDTIPRPYDPADGGEDAGDSDNDLLLDDEECPSEWPCDDSDGDGQPDYMEAAGDISDNDGDGIRDTEDPDDDNDGVPDRDENTFSIDPSADADGDGIPNWTDADDRGDGAPNDCTDDLVPGVCDAPSSYWDYDGDGIPNHFDTDDDGDGVDTADELDVGDPNQNGQPAYFDPLEQGESRVISTAKGRCGAAGGGVWLLSLLVLVGKRWLRRPR